MLRPSWKWLSSRLAARELATPSNAPSRPCLPAMEQLGDRIMLSASPDALASENPPPTFDQVLIGLVKGELKLATSELSAIKLVGVLDSDLIHKFTESLMKVDNVIMNAGENLMKGQLTDLKQNSAYEWLKMEFLKIDQLVGGLPDSERLKTQVEEVKLAASDLLTTLTNVNPVGDLSHKQQELFVKIADTFGDITGGLLKLDEDLLAGKKINGDQEYLKIKFEDILVSSLKQDDEKLKIQLQDALGEANAILIGLLRPTDTGGDVIG
jgi:hypothetical protein